METGFSLALSDNGDVALTKKVTLTGTEFEKVHTQFAQFTPEERKRAHQTLLSQISQSAEAAGELKTSFAGSGQIEFAAKLPAYAERDGDRMYFTLPESLGNLLNLKTSRRENPFYIETPLQQSFSYEITLPEGWTPVLLPEPFSTELPAGAGLVNVIVSSDDGKITIRQEAQLNAAIIPPEQYDKLQELNDRLTAPSARTILLRKQ